ncbi:hypothetical protein DVA67_018165 [Solirubrobacter sp. CPCC 204708]|uniref:Big-1 domain-containing protein n=1 Tax=Solirubrobacter deserti TaxID=2282478 RepID=A0ABT4RCR7_9ACTN|nr:hypothetical protein [Solirubrobacter deserti]MBE2317912.1 hypothetical protein [Solirubrobacter deserti]MDA0136310.1 hypothetical protein [Solirubrobacter deserti]
MILATAALLASWAQVAPSEQAALARTPDTRVHIAWADNGQLFYTDPAEHATVPVAALPGDVRPALLAGPDGLRVFAAGVSGFSVDGLSWQLASNPTTGEVSAAGAVLAWEQDGRVRVGAYDFGPGSTPAVAPGAVAWSVTGGVRVQAIAPDGAPVGEAATVPEASGRPSVVMSAGETIVAAGDVVWRVGSPSTLELPDASVSTLGVDARGRVWAAWSDGARVWAARSNAAVSEFGAPVALGALPVSSLAVNATNTAAHVLAGANGVSYLRRTLPGLTLDERHRREIFTFSVTDAGDPVRGAVVKVGGRSGKTDRNGRVTLRVSNRKLRPTATKQGYEKARLTLK